MNFQGSNGLYTRVTLYPPAAVGGARGWENHVVHLGNWKASGSKPSSDNSGYTSYPGQNEGDCQSFNWTCAASGTWRIVFEANCDVIKDKECSSGFSLKTTSKDESGSHLHCSQQKDGTSVCTGPRKSVSLETSAQMARMFGALRQQQQQQQQQSGNHVQPVHLINNDPHLATSTEAQAQFARMFGTHISHPPALTLVKNVGPSSKDGHTDVTIEIRAANAGGLATE